jgi:hypothetical protein
MCAIVLLTTDSIIIRVAILGGRVIRRRPTTGVSAAVATVGASLVLAVGGPLALDALGVDTLTVGTPDTFSCPFSFASTPTEITMRVGPAVLGVGAAVGLLYAVVRSYRRARPHGDARPQPEG